MANDKTRFIHDHLLPNPRRVLGPQSAALIHCEKHGQFYPKAESCPWCLSWAEEQAAKRRVAPAPASKTPGQLAYEKKYVGSVTTKAWDLLLSDTERKQWEEIAGMDKAIDTDEIEEDDYDTWANMMAMKVWADPYVSSRVRGLDPRGVVAVVRVLAPTFAKQLGMFDRDPPEETP